MKHTARRIALVAAATLLLGSCSCRWHLQRLQQRCPGLLVPSGAVVHRSDTIPPLTLAIAPAAVPAWPLRDFLADSLAPPLPIRTPSISIDLAHLPGDSLAISGTVRTDTIIRTVDVPVYIPVPDKQKPASPLPSWVAAALVALFTIWGIAYTLKKPRQ